MGGRKPDGVGAYPASDAQLQRYEQGARTLARMPVPVLHRSDDPHAFLYFAMLDGSGQDLAKGGRAPTNVGQLYQQLRQHAESTGSRIGAGYVAGPGTQQNLLVAAADNVLGFSYDERIKKAYLQLANAAYHWKSEERDARISVASVGYSRGAVEIPGLTRLIDRYGIADPGDLRFGRDGSGNLTVESRLPPLVPPHETAQAVVLLDPVGTGIPEDYDRRLPPGVISGITLLAADERRALAFPHTTIIHQGVTPDGRFLGLTVPGAHGDVGGGNHRNGLEILAGNLVSDYLNALSDAPLVNKRALAAPEDTVVHRSEQALAGLFQIGSSHPGDPRALHEQLCVVVDPCRDAEPRDDVLAGRFATQQPRIAPVPDAARTIGGQGPAARVVPLRQPVLLDDPSHPQHPLYRQSLAGVSSLDARFGREPDVGSRQLAGALAARALESGLQRISHVVLSEDRTRVFAVDTADPGAPQRRLAAADVVPGREQAMHVSTRLAEQTAPPAPPVPARTREQDQPAHALAR